MIYDPDLSIQEVGTGSAQALVWWEGSCSSTAHGGVERKSQNLASLSRTLLIPSPQLSLLTIMLHFCRSNCKVLQPVKRGVET